MKVLWKGKSFYISKNFAMNLDGFVKGVMTKNTSAVFIFDGKSGQGKTTLCSQVGCYISKAVKEYYEKNPKWGKAPEFSLDCMTWTPKDFLAKFDDIKKGSIVILDEGMILSNRSTMSEVNRAVVIAMSLIRSKQIFVFFNVNSLFDLDRNIVLHRSDVLLHLYPRKAEFGSRGAYMAVPSSGGKLKNLYINGKKFYDYSKARIAFSDTFSAFFPFEDKDYEKRKQLAIKTYFESGGGNNQHLMVKRSRDRYIKYLNDKVPSLNQDDIARIGDVSLRTVSRAVSYLRDEELE